MKLFQCCYSPQFWIFCIFDPDLMNNISGHKTRASNKSAAQINFKGKLCQNKTKQSSGNLSTHLWFIWTTFTPLSNTILWSILPDMLTLTSLPLNSDSGHQCIINACWGKAQCNNQHYKNPIQYPSLMPVSHCPAQYIGSSLTQNTAQ